MLYMLDTNICIFLLGKKKRVYFDRLDDLQVKKGHDIAISTIVLAELQFGVANSQQKEKNQRNLNVLLGRFNILDYNDKCAYFYGELRTALKKDGCLIGANDLLIASHAMAEEAILITNNLKEFQRIKELKVEHWEQ
jgi:tRNA(fMet)-specific endonuclease VapC